MDKSNNFNKMTEDERIQLAAKLDKELEQFVDGLPKRSYEDGWAEESWEQEMESHPFFMTKPPEAGEELHPLYEGLQQLKYDPDVNSPKELATSYKEDGNFNFKHKNYRLAVVAFTEGLKSKCDDPEIDATLYNNRAAAHYFLKNYRSSLKDCEAAINLKPNYLKALCRAAQCCQATNKLELCVTYCDKILEIESDNGLYLKMKNDCAEKLDRQKKQKKIEERDERKREKIVGKLYEAIVKRGINIKKGRDGLLELFNDCYEQFAKVRLEKDGSLTWPVTLMYPENHFQAPDYIQSFPEGDTFKEIFRVAFSSPAEWDPQFRYKLETISVYYKSTKNKFVPVQLSDTLGNILSQKDFLIEDGTPLFYIFVRSSELENMLVNER
ncbi:DNA polymerase interacting tetratricopeptide repeat-containing, protein of 47 kDa [Coccinella septempunctata]|uniref:DNA polymerase interacting tetratricopeptide repeat-containing, protein of 47 kDa n=1 Tax=Coccinella septempunctata TaxID=41139 RepID=UPI001D07CF4E|nr:DNA polymerase interacting tetratricopeptide repeat-containing, protein of 47 kDa [Coccinella septempunctata]